MSAGRTHSLNVLGSTCELTRLIKGFVPMHSMHLTEKWHLMVVTYTEPFSGSDIVDVARSMPIPGSVVGAHIGALVDLRAVDISKLSASDSQRAIAVRKTRIQGHPAEPLAFLLKDLREHGTVRMHSLWAEALGLREEKDTFVTISIRAALDWLEAGTGQPGMAASLAEGIDGAGT
jgi:hypothetical protein